MDLAGEAAALQKRAFESMPQMFFSIHVNPHVDDRGVILFISILSMNIPMGHPVKNMKNPDFLMVKPC